LTIRAARWHHRGAAHWALASAVGLTICAHRSHTVFNMTASVHFLGLARQWRAVDAGDI